MKRAILKAIRFYQTAVSPLFPPRCRFIPTCSQYALEAIENCGQCFRHQRRRCRAGSGLC